MTTFISLLTMIAPILQSIAAIVTAVVATRRPPIDKELARILGAREQAAEQKIAQLQAQVPAIAAHDAKATRRIQWFTFVILLLSLVLGYVSVTYKPIYESPIQMGRLWQLFNSGNFSDAAGYARRCIYQYEDKASEIQAQLKMKGAPEPRTGQVSAMEQDQILGQKILNDIGACYFVLAESSVNTFNFGDARGAYDALSQYYSYARVYDPSAGFFWSPSEHARCRVKIIGYKPPDVSDWPRFLDTFNASRRTSCN